jgi:hypothetical protein
MKYFSGCFHGTKGFTYLFNLPGSERLFIACYCIECFSESDGQVRPAGAKKASQVFLCVWGGLNA